MVEAFKMQLRKRKGLFPNFPAPINGKFHSIAVREKIMRAALEIILQTRGLDGETARDIASDALREAFPPKMRRELERDLSEIHLFEIQRERRDWPKSSENPEEHTRLHEESMAHSYAIHAALQQAFARTQKGGQ